MRLDRCTGNFVMALAFVFVGSSPSVSAGISGPNRVALTSNKPVYALAEPVIVEISFTNAGDAPLKVHPQWATMGVGWVSYSVSADGKQYQPVPARAFRDPAGSSVRLAPGESI